MHIKRIGRVYLHSCGWIWSSRSEKIKRCPHCDTYLKKGDLVKITAKLAKEIYAQYNEVVQPTLSNVRLSWPGSQI